MLKARYQITANEVLRLEKLRVVGTPELPRDLEHHWLVVKQLLLRDRVVTNGV